jgi:hypothetical protein
MNGASIQCVPPGPLDFAPSRRDAELSILVRAGSPALGHDATATPPSAQLARATRVPCSTPAARARSSTAACLRPAPGIASSRTPTRCVCPGIGASTLRRRTSRQLPPMPHLVLIHIHPGPTEKRARHRPPGLTRKKNPPKPPVPDEYALPRGFEVNVVSSSAGGGTAAGAREVGSERSRRGMPVPVCAPSTQGSWGVTSGTRNRCRPSGQARTFGP